MAEVKKPSIRNLSNILGKFEKFNPDYTPSIQTNFNEDREVFVVSEFPKKLMDFDNIELVEFWGAVWDEHYHWWFIHY